MQTYNLMKSGLNAAQLRSKTNVNKTGKIEVKTDTSGAVRTDGNNVDLESEKVNQAANTLMYNGLISLTNSKLSMAKSVITGR